MQKSSPMIANCLIWGNSSLSGAGGIMVRDSSFPTIVNCTITDNMSADADLGDAAGGIYSRDSVATLVNCILWGDIGPEIFVSNTIFYPNRVPVVSYSDVHWGGTGNIHADPLFVDPANEDFRLQAGSPCIDTGDHSTSPDTDLEGTPRPQDGNLDGIAVVDMGAYEVGPASSLMGMLFDTPNWSFANRNHPGALQNKLEAVVNMIQREDFKQAVHKLQNDILKKVDGCVRSGAPDKDDWIIDCMYQQLIYQRVSWAIEALRTMPARN